MSLESEANFHCPYCGSVNFLEVDYSGGKSQELVNDCETCCKPVLINITVEENIVCVHAKRENE